MLQRKMSSQDFLNVFEILLFKLDKKLWIVYNSCYQKFFTQLGCQTKRLGMLILIYRYLKGSISDHQDDFFLHILKID